MSNLLFSAGERGATFSEVMVSVALTGIGVMGAMAAFEAGGKSLERDALVARALAMAESRIEAKRGIPWEQLLLDDVDHDGAPEVTMHDDGSRGDRTAGDGIHSAMLKQNGVTLVWTVAFTRHGNPGASGAVVIEARGIYATNSGEREVRLATLRANPAFAGSH
jgi:hypothetical protein